METCCRLSFLPGRSLICHSWKCIYDLWLAAFWVLFFFWLWQLQRTVNKAYWQSRAGESRITGPKSAISSSGTGPRNRQLPLRTEQRNARSLFQVKHAVLHKFAAMRLVVCCLSALRGAAKQTVSSQWFYWAPRHTFTISGILSLY